MADFNTWLKGKDIDPEALTEPMRKALTAAWRAEENPEPAEERDAKPEATFDKKFAAIEAENERIEYIQASGTALMEKYRGHSQKCRDIKALIDAAVADQTIDARAFDLKLMRLGRYDGAMPYTREEGQATASIVEAAVCRRAGLQNIESHFDVRTLEQSERHYRHGLSLVGLLDESAKRNGWRGRAEVQSKDFLRAAFGMGGDGGLLDIRAGTTGPSTYSLPNIVGNVANKFLKSGWLSVDNTWMRLAYRRSVNDFKTITTARLNGALIYRTLGAGGEIKHGTVSESTFTNSANTYAIMLGIDRRDLINDDLGALTELSRHFGRGAGLKINDLFWTVFLNNSAFFTAGNNNTSTGGGSALGSADGAAINAAEVKFINQTDPNTYPIALTPKILLAPPTLANTARRWMGSFGMVQSGTAGLGDSNIFQGRYSVETSPYMENANYTGNSNAAWYLLADPNDEAVIEGVAVNNRWEPTVDTAEPDFNQLGMAMRGYIDVGFAFKEPRAGVRSAGS